MYFYTKPVDYLLDAFVDSNASMSPSPAVRKLRFMIAQTVIGCLFHSNTEVSDSLCAYLLCRTRWRQAFSHPDLCINCCKVRYFDKCVNGPDPCSCPYDQKSATRFLVRRRRRNGSKRVVHTSKV